ncbi:unnamed protein product [Larinioides sclopetarius]|uniref:Uncharacterized protein n=1 Tax=Larinioides sclopetarius TaxID=280406 RepID=A0AAV2B2R9_9ARAC
MEIDFNYTEGSYIMGFQLNLFEIRFFYASSRPQVFIGIHSPFVPNNPLEDGLAIYPGKSYELQVELEKEEHSLPPPYQTSCSDNGPSEDVKPFTNPNSYQADPDDFAKILIFVKNTEVSMLRHVPLYGSGEVFSYVGGLAGFWLGVSVFSFTDIIEKLYRKAMNWMVNFRLENVQNALFLEAHHD